MILLLTPPFDHTALEPGYIKGYVPGVRENGAQYTHAAVWAAIAFAELGDGDKAHELLGMLNPITHSSTPADVERYRVEPYVSVGDVYSAEGARRSRRMDLVQRIGGMALSRRDRMAARHPAARIATGDQPVHSRGMARVSPQPSGTERRATRSSWRIRAACAAAWRRSNSTALALADRSGVPLVDDGKVHAIRVIMGAA